MYHGRPHLLAVGGLAVGGCWGLGEQSLVGSNQVNHSVIIPSDVVMTFNVAVKRCLVASPGPHHSGETGQFYTSAGPGDFNPILRETTSNARIFSTWKCLWPVSRLVSRMISWLVCWLVRRTIVFFVVSFVARLYICLVVPVTSNYLVDCLESCLGEIWTRVDG